MFESINDIPSKLVEFYYEDAQGFLVAKERVVLLDNVNISLAHNSNFDTVKEFLLLANKANRWEFHDKYIQWMQEEPISISIGSSGEEDGSENPSFFSEAHDAWLAKEPTEPEVRELASYSNYSNWLKLQGVMFEGVRCSASKEDMWGLSSVAPIVRKGVSLQFHFDSGDTLLLTPDNIDAFEAVWIPFRLQFFS